MTLLAHISDLHFGRERPEVLEGLLVSLTEKQPELIIVSGDLTQRARRREYLAAAAFLGRLPRPWLAVPGNHDLAAYNLLERFCFPWQKWRQLIAKELEPWVDGPGYVVAGVNTARTWASPLDWAQGRISPEQTLEVQRRLRNRLENQLRLLIAHHPFWLPESQRHRHLIGGRDAALKRLQAGGVDLILSGHVHLAYTHPLEGIIISHAGTSGSDRLLPGHPNSYNLIRGDRRTLEIDRLEWHGAGFVRQDTATFFRNMSGWVAAE